MHNKEIGASTLSAKVGEAINAGYLAALALENPDAELALRGSSVLGDDDERPANPPLTNAR